MKDGNLFKHERALYLLARGENVWESDIEAMKELRQDIINVVIPSFHHGQEAEQGVQEIAICGTNQKAENVGSALACMRSYDNQWIYTRKK